MIRTLKSVGVGLLLACCGLVACVISAMFYYSRQVPPGTGISIDLSILGTRTGFWILPALLFVGGFYFEYRRLAERHTS
jgi:hypothetical protein